MNSKKIIEQLPYSHPFLFVDEIESVDETGIKGNYTIPVSSFFYQGHFKDNPVTPGVILTEIMAQIGLVALGIFILKTTSDTKESSVALSHTDIHFYMTVLPDETVYVESEKVYFRFQKLKCNVKMYNKERKLVAKGSISGMLISA